MTSMSSPGETAELVERLRRFFLPGCEERARGIRGIAAKQRGEFRGAPTARWIPFTSEDFIDATRSAFRWEARMSGGTMKSVVIVDAYENAHGLIAVKLGGIVPVKKVTGEDVDKGEIQRYLASLALCPPMMINHPGLQWSVAGIATLRLRDLHDATGSTVDIEIDGDGRPAAFRADRPRAAGERSVITPWSGTCGEYREIEGVRIATKLEVSWELPDGMFTYYHGEVTTLTMLR